MGRDVDADGEDDLVMGADVAQVDYFLALAEWLRSSPRQAAPALNIAESLAADIRSPVTTVG